jgi:hypothetical protein
VIQFDKTQPVEIRPRYDFGGGVILQRVSAIRYTNVLTGEEYRAEHVVYESTLETQKSRSAKTI